MERSARMVTNILIVITLISMLNGFFNKGDDLKDVIAVLLFTSILVLILGSWLYMKYLHKK